jgi:hypothetical protein
MPNSLGCMLFSRCVASGNPFMRLALMRGSLADNRHHPLPGAAGARERDDSAHAQLPAHCHVQGEVSCRILCILGLLWRQNIHGHHSQMKETPRIMACRCCFCLRPLRVDRSLKARRRGSLSSNAACKREGTGGLGVYHAAERPSPTRRRRGSAKR